MFEKTLTDLIRGIRANKKTEQKYIAVCLQEIRTEVKSNDPDIKAQAVAKLTYLQMLGYDMSWASFHIVEVMSSPKLLHKRAGYLAAAQSFQQDTDVLMLTTNLIKKDLASSSPLEIAMAVNGLSQIVTPDLARDLCQDLVSMLNHSKPYIRKKVVLLLYKVFLRFPEALRLCFPRLKEKLEDPDPSVVSATVSVICELARKNPRNYLSLAPQLFKLLTTSTNNWMLIKIIKMFASMTPLEPRLIKKLLPPLTSLIQTTPAMSLLYECIHTVITGGFLEAAGESSHALAAMCASKLRKFLEDPDQNLKYVGLLAMGRMLETHPKLIVEHKDMILDCIDDDDFSIRFRALDLVVGMANRKSLVDIVKRLIAHLVPADEPADSSLHEASSVLNPVYRTDIINRIIFICSQGQYRNVSNFEWYITVLVGIVYVNGINVGEALTNQLMDVAVRVKSVRPFAVKQMYRLLADNQFLKTAKKRDSNIEVLAAAAWICGEYCGYLENIPSTLECLLTPAVVDLPAKVQAIYVQNIIKIYAYWVKELIDDWNIELQHEFVKVTRVIKDKMSMFIRCQDLEVQERTYNTIALLNVVLSEITDEPATDRGLLILRGFPDLFSLYELNPVAPKAQKKVPLPEGIDLDVWINQPLPDLVDDSDSDNASADLMITETESVQTSKKKSKKSKKRGNSDDEAEKERRREARLEARRQDPFYIMSEKSNGKSQPQLLDLDQDVDSIPIVKLSLDDFPGSKKGKKSKSGKGRSKRTLSPPPPVYAPEEMPEDAVASASDDETKNAERKRTAYYARHGQDIFEAEDTGLNTVDLSTPLGEDERFPKVQTYLSPEELRRREEAKAKAERKERQQRNAARKKEEASTKKSSSKKAKQSSTDGAAAPQKKKKSKKSKKTVDKEISNSVEVPDMSADAVERYTEHERPRLALFANDDIELEHQIVLSDEKDGETSIVTLRLFVKNKRDDATLSNICFTPVQSFDFRLVEDQKDQHTESLTDAFTLSDRQATEVVGHFVVMGDVRRGLCIRSELQYDVQDSSLLHQYPLEIPVPASTFVVQEQPPMDPSQFASLLAEHGSEFDYHDTVTKDIPVTDDIAVDQILIRALNTITATTRLHVVEVVPGAASLYAKSAQGPQLAGLLRYTLSMDEAPKMVTLSIDLKCTDDGFLEGFVDELSNLDLK